MKNLFHKGNKINVGKHRSPKTEFKKKDPRITGMGNRLWKGDKVGYRALHDWINKWKGKANRCEMCGIKKRKRYQWANIDHKYKRVLDDYVSLCAKCHQEYDIKYNNYGKK